MLCPSCERKLNLTSLTEDLIDYYDDEDNEGETDEIGYGDRVIGFVIGDIIHCPKCKSQLEIEIRVSEYIS